MSKYLKNTGLFTLIVISILLLKCADKNANPFAIEGNAGLLIKDRTTVKLKDTVNIFSSETIFVGVNLSEFIDSIYVTADSNRLWDDKDSVLYRNDFNAGQELKFIVSFFDTGNLKVTLRAFHASKKIDTITYSLYAKSPLFQKEITAAKRDTILLETPPVKDKLGITYNWDFLNGTPVFKSVSPTSNKYPVGNTLGKYGHLYIEDLNGKRSPAYQFKINYTLGKEGPISFLADTANGDTILTVSEEYSLRVRLVGFDFSEESALIDGVAFDQVFPDGDTIYDFVKNYTDLDSVPRKIVVTAKDFAGNEFESAFFLKYDSSLRQALAPKVIIAYPTNDSLETPLEQIAIRGFVKQVPLNDTLALFAQVNDTMLSDPINIIADSSWTKVVNLYNGLNRIVVSLYDDPEMRTEAISSDTVFVVRKVDAIDKTPPQINGIFVNGKIYRDSMIVDPLVSIIGARIFDISNIKSVTFNGKEFDSSFSQELFFARIGLTHSKAGNRILIKATDQFDNFSEKNIIIFQNRKPIFVTLPNWEQIVVDSTVNAIVKATDEDKDSVNYTIRIRNSKLDTIFSLQTKQSFTWKPLLRDTGENVIHVFANDGYEISDTTRKFFVTKTINEYIPVKFLTTSKDFPDTIRGEIDTVKLKLQVAPQTGKAPFTFSGAFVYDTTKKIPVSSDGTILWGPTDADTGLQRIRFVVTDSLNKSDTLNITTRVLPLQIVTVQFERSTSNDFEAKSPVLIKVVLSEPSSKLITVPFEFVKVNSTADSLDFELSQTRSIQFDPNEREKTINVGIINDLKVEKDETIVLRLKRPTGNATLGRVIEHTYTIQDDDKINVKFASENSSGSESVGLITVGVQLSKAISETLSVLWEIDSVNSQANVLDYKLPANRSLIFVPGDSVALIDIKITNDSLVEPDEKIFIRLVNADPFGKIIEPSQHSITIVNDDTPQEIKAYFSIASSTVSEIVGQMQIKVQLSKAPTNVVTLNYSVDTIKSNASKEDYNLTTGFLIFNPGEIEKVISYSILNDTKIEEAESLFIQLTNPSKDVTLGIPSVYKCIITDDDTPADVKISFALSNLDNFENSPADIAVTLSTKTTVPITVNFTVDTLLSSASKSDYTLPAVNTITFNPGDTVKTIRIGITDDNSIEASETILLKLVNPSKYSILGDRTSFTYTIKDNDKSISVVINPTGTGSVVRTVNNVENIGPYLIGTVVTLKAVPSPGYVFSSWSGAITGSENPRTLNVQSNQTINANFMKISKPVITLEPISRTVLEGDTARFSLVASGLEKRYTWFKNNVSIAGSSDSVLIVPKVTYSDNGSKFKCIVSNASGADTSAEVVLTVNLKPPVISSHPSPVAVTENSRVSFSISASGTNMSFQWQRNNVAIPGATQNPYVIQSVSLSDNGAMFRCVVSNSGGTITSNAAQLTVQQVIFPPNVTSDPRDTTITEGDSTVFKILATGTNLSYQWQKNGINIPGANNNTYNTPALQWADNTAKYRCIVSNSIGKDTSLSATLTIRLKVPVITRDPQDATVTEGQNVTFSIDASGTNRTLQWLQNGTPITGATSSAYTLSNVTYANNNFKYRCVVMNSAGKDTSNEAILLVRLIPPTITAEPRDTTVREGTTANFNVIASGTSITYAWYRNSIAISGATDATYSKLNAAYPDSNSLYICVVSNNGGKDTSRAARLHVWLNPPVISTNPVDTSAYVGESVTFWAQATGTNISYKWQKNQVDIPGATANNLTLSNVQLTNSGETYRCKISNSGGTVYTNDAILTVALRPAAPTITTQPQNKTVNVGQPVTFTIAATGVPTPSFQWLLNGNAISGAEGPSHTISSTTMNDNQKEYSCRVTNLSGTLTSDPATLTVIPAPPVILTQPLPVTITEGNTVTFTITASGHDTSFQWQKKIVGGSFTNITNANQNIYTTPVLGLSDNGTLFRCLVSNRGGEVKSDSVLLTVTQVIIAPSIRVGPQNTTVNEGQTASFSITALGTNLAFQWQLNDEDIPNARGNTYVTPALNYTDNGNSYRCIVSNTLGIVTSTPASVTVELNPPVIDSISDDTTVLEGTSANFRVYAKGTNISYAWYKNGALVTDSDNNPSVLTLPTVNFTDNNSSYRCVVTNSAGSVQSSLAYLAVTLRPPVITQNLPTTLSKTENDQVTLTVNVNGTNLNYTWYRGNDIVGSNTNSYSFSATASLNNTSYKCIISNSGGTVTSNILQLSVALARPTIITSPRDTTVLEGTVAYFHVQALGSNLVYKWLKDIDTLENQTASTLTLQNVTYTDHNSTIKCVVRNSAGFVESNTATLRVDLNPPVITNNLYPRDTVVMENGTATFRVFASGTALTYKWYKGTSLISGANNPVYTLSNVSYSENGKTFYCVVSNGTNPSNIITSRAATLTVNLYPPTITQDISSQTVQVGSSVSFTVAARGTDLSYQWERERVPINSNGTDPVYTISSASLTDNGKTYRCRISNAAGTIYSNEVILTVTPPLTAPSIVTQPQPATVTEGNSASFSIVLNSDVYPIPAITWYKNGSEIANSNVLTYQIQNTNLDMNGDRYRAYILNSEGNVTSNEVRLTVNQITEAPTITSQPEHLTVVAGDNATFTVVATGIPTPTFQWYRGSEQISGATNDTLILNSVTTSMNNLEYKCFISNSSGNLFSNVAKLTVYWAPIIETQPISQTVTEGSSVTFTVSANGNPSLSYQWKVNGTNVLNNGNESSYTIQSAALAMDGNTYSCDVINNVGTRSTQSALLRVNPGNSAPVIQSQPIGQTKNAGESASFSVTATGFPAPTYQWFKNGQIIPGATSASYITPVLTANDNASLFKCKVKNSVDSLYTDEVLLTVHYAPIFTSQPTDMTVNVNEQAEFHAAATGLPTPTYQWYKNDVPIPGATSSTYTIPSASSDLHGKSFKCIATNSVSSTQSQSALLSVNIPPQIDQDISNVTVVNGNSVTLNFGVTSRPLATYVWYLEGAQISGATSATLVLNNVDETYDGKKIKCKASNSLGYIMSSEITITVTTPPPTIRTQPVDVDVIEGNEASFSINAFGAGTLTYQWYRNNNLIAGATSPTLRFGATVVLDNTTYSCNVTNSGGVTTSNTVTLRVHTTPVIINAPTNTSINHKDGVTFVVTASGTHLNYQWEYRRNVSGATWVSIGSNSNTLTLSTAVTTRNGTYDDAIFRCTVSNLKGRVTTPTFKLSIR